MESSRKTALNKRVKLIALVGIVATFPFSKILLLNNVAIMLLTLNWLFESSFGKKWQTLKENPLVFYFILLDLVYLAAYCYSDNHKNGLFELEKKICIFLIPLVLGSSPPLSGKELRIVFKSFVLLCLVASLMCFAYAIYRNYQEGYTLSYLFNAIVHQTHEPGKYEYFNFWYFTYALFASAVLMHPVYLALYILTSSFLSVWLWWESAGKSLSGKILLIIFLSFNALLIILLSSKTQIIALLLFLTIFILYRATKAKMLFAGISIILLIFAAILFFLWKMPVLKERVIEASNPGKHYSQNKYGEGGFSLRIYKWKYSIEAIQQNLPFGTGTGDAQDELQRVYKLHDFKIGYENHFNSHNQYLQTLLETGIPGFLALALSLLIPLFLAIKKKCGLYIAFIALFMLSCITESMLEVNKGIVFYSIFNAIFAFSLLKSNLTLTD